MHTATLNLLRPVRTVREIEAHMRQILYDAPILGFHKMDYLTLMEELLVSLAEQKERAADRAVKQMMLEIQALLNCGATATPLSVVDLLWSGLSRSELARIHDMEGCCTFPMLGDQKSVPMPEALIKGIREFFNKGQDYPNITGHVDPTRVPYHAFIGKNAAETPQWFKDAVNSPTGQIIVVPTADKPLDMQLPAIADRCERLGLKEPRWLNGSGWVVVIRNNIWTGPDEPTIAPPLSLPLASFRTYNDLTNALVQAKKEPSRTLLITSEQWPPSDAEKAYMGMICKRYGIEAELVEDMGGWVIYTDKVFPEDTVVEDVTETEPSEPLRRQMRIGYSTFVNSGDPLEWVRKAHAVPGGILLLLPSVMGQPRHDEEVAIRQACKASGLDLTTYQADMGGWVVSPPKPGKKQKANVSKLYLQSIDLIEALHVRFLDLVKDDLDRRGYQELTAAQALTLHGIGNQTVSHSDIKARGYYRGSNVSYNIKKLIELGFLHHAEATKDRRSVEISLTSSGVKAAMVVELMYSRQIQNIDNLSTLTPQDLTALVDHLQQVSQFWSTDLAAPPLHSPDSR